MAAKQKKENNSELLILALILVGLVAFVQINNMKEKNKKPTKKVEEKVVTHSDEEITKLYNSIKLKLDEDHEAQVLVNFMKEEPVSVVDTTAEYKNILAIKNVRNSEIYTDSNASKVPAINGYKYTGKYMALSSVKASALEHFNITLEPKSIITSSTYYYYDAKKEEYRIYNKEEVATKEKVTHMEASWTDEAYIYIDEYSAFTYTNTDPNTSYTRHNKLLPINITDKNIIENLDIIDHYKYTFKYNENNKTYQLYKIEYINDGLKVEK